MTNAWLSVEGVVFLFIQLVFLKAVPPGCFALPRQGVPH